MKSVKNDSFIFGSKRSALTLALLNFAWDYTFGCTELEELTLGTHRETVVEV